MEQEHRAHKLRELVVHSPKAYARLAKLLSETGEEGVLFCLLHSDGSLLPGELAARLDLTSGRIANILRSLESKGLVSLDYHLPLSNFDYSAYAPWPLHGSAALTAAGQEALDSLEVQGIEE